MKFIICSAPRTGSHALASALGEHSGLKVAGEVFFRPDKFNVTGTNLVEVIESAFSQFDGVIHHRTGDVRFPFFTNQQLWDEIFKKQDLKFVYLQRRDLLAMTISLFIAESTHTWQIGCRQSAILNGYSTDITSAKPISLDARKVEFYLNRYKNEIGKFDQHLENKDFIRLYYEDLKQDWEKEITKTQEFLGVSVQSLFPATLAQSGGREYVQNYSELQEHFKSTKWAYLFA